MKRHWHIPFRDLFLGALALVILYDQVFIAKAAQPLLIFLVVFLFASIPALRGDSKDDEFGPFARFVMMMLGIDVPPPPPPSDDESGTPSSSDTQTSSEWEQYVEHSPEEQHSSKRS